MISFFITFEKEKVKEKKIHILRANCEKIDDELDSIFLIKKNLTQYSGDWSGKQTPKCGTSGPRVAFIWRVFLQFLGL